MDLSSYDKNALTQIQKWKNPEVGAIGKFLEVINKPIDKAGDVIFSAPGVGVVLKKSVEGLTGVCNDFAQWTVRKEAIYEEYRNAGFSQIVKASDINGLNLSEVDSIVGFLGAKYKGIAALEGAGTGLAGAFGIPPDLIALISMNLRAIGEYATYYGFNNESQEERLFALNVLTYASSPTDASKQLAMAQLVRIAKDVAKNKAWRDLEKHAFVQIIQQIAKALGIRLTKAKLAQAIPLTGAAVGAGFNAYYTTKVCETAFNLYRERFLAQKYGDDLIKSKVEPADELNADYEDAEILEEVV